MCTGIDKLMLHRNIMKILVKAESISSVGNWELNSVAGSIPLSQSSGCK